MYLHTFLYFSIIGDWPVLSSFIVDSFFCRSLPTRKYDTHFLYGDKREFSYDTVLSEKNTRTCQLLMGIFPFYNSFEITKSCVALAFSASASTDDLQIGFWVRSSLPDPGPNFVEELFREVTMEDVYMISYRFEKDACFVGLPVCKKDSVPRFHEIEVL